MALGTPLTRVLACFMSYVTRLPSISIHDPYPIHQRQVTFQQPYIDMFATGVTW